MQKSQVLLVGAAAALLVVLVAFGRTTPKTDKNVMPTAAHQHSGQEAPAFQFSDLLASAKKKIPAEKLLLVNEWENKVVRGDVKGQQILAFKQLYTVWDSLNQLPVAAYYLGEAAKLENSEKSLTFAANLFLEHLQHAPSPEIGKWEATQAAALLDKAIALNPGNDSLKIRQASAYMIAEEPMSGVARLREVVAANPDNIEAQVTLANLAITSGQFDKAISRMEELLKRHPEEAKAIFILAEAYKNQGNNKKAVELFKRCKELLKDPELKTAIDNYIKDIK